MAHTLPEPPVMFKALVERDSTFEGIFFAAIKTTGIFCRPTCTAKKPLAKNVEYYPTPKEAILHGYRPCKVCHPERPLGASPDWLEQLLEILEHSPQREDL